MSLITDIRPGEPDLIGGHEREALELRSLDGRVLASFPAPGEWSHEKLKETIVGNHRIVEEAGGADYYLGTQFVGGTEV